MNLDLTVQVIPIGYNTEFGKYLCIWINLRTHGITSNNRNRFGFKKYLFGNLFERFSTLTSSGFNGNIVHTPDLFYEWIFFSYWYNIIYIYL